MFGNFCCPECAAAYIFDSDDCSDEIWEKYSLLNYLYNTDNNNIQIAPPRLTLKKFGGHLSIEDFRKCCNNSHKKYKIILPPMISSIPIIEEFNVDVNKKSFIPLDQDRVSKVNEEYKLKRNKPLPDYKNTLENCMRLKYN